MPLIGVLAATAVKEAIEDIKRHKMDTAMNGSRTLKLQDGKWVEVTWRNIQVSKPAATSTAPVAIRCTALQYVADYPWDYTGICRQP